uniref:ZP domain-containing protein n=1 Tax=Parastrongyloides trichosuri TaxID=131310 RepID=A0A0N5A0K7_PARTI
MFQMFHFLLIFINILFSVYCNKFPNEVVETPIVTCEPDKVTIKIKTSLTNPSVIYADNFFEDSDCSVYNMNHISIPHGKCGMTSENMSSPNGVLQRICISVQLHPLFVTEADKYYCAQCVYMESNVVNDLEQTLSVSEATPSELEPMFDDVSIPKCSYSIRRGSKDGPKIHYTTIGEVAYHVWTCNNDNVGILVQNCYVEDFHGNKILIIDQNGCGVDQYVLPTPEYTDDLRTAYQKTHVFKFAENTLTKFTCQIRLCLKNNGNKCKNITPPSLCPTIEEREQGVLVHKNESFVEEIEHEINDLNYSGENPIKTENPNVAVEQSLKIENNPGYNSGTNEYEKKHKRSITLTANGTNMIENNKKSYRLIKTADGQYPELDVFGLIRIVDSDEEARMLEARLNDNYDFKHNDPYMESSFDSKCTSVYSYWIAVVLLLLFTIFQLVVLFIYLQKNSNISTNMKKMNVFC